MVGANGKKIFDFDNPRSADIEIVGWCPAVPVLPPWREGVSLALLDHPSSDVITIKIPYGVDVLLYQPTLHPIFSYWVG